MKKKLLFIVNVDWFFISHRLPIALSAIEAGFEVHIACGITNKKTCLENNGLIVHPITLSRSGVSIINELKTIQQLFSVIKSVRPHIIHSVTIKPVLYGNILARFFKVPIRVSSISGLGYVFIADGLKAKLFRWLIAILYKSALVASKAVIFQNTSDRDILKQLGVIKTEQEIFIRGSGVNLDLYPVTAEPEDTPVVMLVARLLIDKGVNEFVAAAQIIQANRTDIRMVLVGDTDLENPKSISPKQLIHWVSTGIIEHWGFSKNVAQTMAKANIIVLPSYREGLPKSLIEAAACGRAVITTDVPGCRDAIEANITGVLVPVKADKPLADAIVKLVDDSAKRHQYALSARKLAEQAFDINDVIKKHLEIYSCCYS
ncbi:MAG: glycosyltransferase family 4 protein [Colwellia sp.]